MSAIGLPRTGGHGGWRLRASASLRHQAVPLTLGGAMLLAAYVYLHQMRGTTLYGDEWLWVLNRRGESFATYLNPHNGHFSLVPIFIYKVIWTVWGLHNDVPLRLLVVGLHLVGGGLVFVYARTRIPAALALVPAVLMLFYGAGAENVVWPFQSAWLISVICGIGALLLLDRPGRRFALGACALVAIGLASSGPGLAVACGVAVDVLARPERRHRWWVAVLPLMVFGLWWIGYQHTQPLTQTAVRGAPGFVWHTVAASTSGLLGLWNPLAPTDGLAFGAPLVLGLVGAVGWRLKGRPQLAPRVTSLIVIVVVFGLSTAVNRDLIADGYAGRYLYVVAVFILLLLVELVQPARVPRGGLLAIGLLTVGAVLSGINWIGYVGAVQRSRAQSVRADLAALHLERSLIGANYATRYFPGAPFIALNATRYFAAARELGTPAVSAGGLGRLSDSSRLTADQELIAIQAPALVPLTGRATLGFAPPAVFDAGGHLAATGRCAVFSAALYAPPGSAAVVVSLHSGTVLIDARSSPASVSLRRYAAAQEPVGAVPSGGRELLTLRPDTGAAPWLLTVATAGTVRVCGVSRLAPGASRPPA